MNHWDENESLKRALEESLNEQIRMIPPKEQIEKEYKFSKAFEHDMELLMKKRKKRFSIVKIALCVFLLLGIGWYKIGYFQADYEPKYTNIAEKKEDLKVKENKTSKEPDDKTSFAESDTDEISIFIKEDKENNKSLIEEKEEEAADPQKEEDIITSDPKGLEKNDETVLGNSTDEGDISKASIGTGKQVGVESHFLSATVEGEAIQVTLQIENQSDTNIICETASSLLVLEDDNWVELSDSEGVILDEEKEVLSGETYEATILLEGFSIEKGQQYKLIKTIGEEKKEFEFNL